MRGTVLPVNRAMLRPILIGGVEKQLVFMNAFICFPFIAITHMQVPQCFVGVGVFIVLHILLRIVTKYDPQLGKLFKRATRYLFQAYFPARSYPENVLSQTIKSVGY